MLAVLGVGALIAVGCTGDDDGDDMGATSTATSVETTTTTASRPDCVVAPVLAEVDEALAAARLTAGAGWQVGDRGTTFTERTVPVERFREQLGLDCAVEAVQTTGSGDERLALVAWTGPRVTFVVQSGDAPTSAYETAARFDLLIEWTYGEYLEGPQRPNREDRAVWAATLEQDATSILVAARDYPVGAVAKSWQAGFETGDTEDYVSLDAERYGIDRVRAAGARNVGLGELPEVGSEIASLAYLTPAGQLVETRVAPLGWIEPDVPWHQRGVTEEEIDGVTAYLSEAGPPDDADVLTYDIAHITFECGDWVWHVMTGFGSTDELREWVTHLVGTLDCAG